MTPFVITISDGFCTWQYDIDFPNADNMAIKDILLAVKDKFNGTVVKSECIKVYNHENINR